MKKTCTFKNDTAPSGLARVGWIKGADIKYEKKSCGHIVPPSHWTKETQYKVSLQVKDEISWKWVTLKARFDSLDEAKDWCKANWENIMQKYNLHFRED